MTATFAYNPASQIVRRTRSDDAYVAPAPAATDAYTADSLNRIASVDAAAFAYDPNGNLTAQPATVTGSAARTYLYDIENRLVSSSSAGVTTRLRYDPLGRLYETQRGGSVRRFLWDGDALVAEYDGAGAELHRYVHGGGAGVDDPIVWYRATNTDRRRLHPDHLGSIVAVADDDGENIAINRYDEWGVPDPGNLGRFGYTGQIWLPEIDLFHYKARMYSPELGRFLQVDPVGYEDQISLYAYVGSDPVNQIDPSGECFTGSRTGESAFCRTHMDYLIEGDGGPRAPHGPRAYGGGGGGGDGDDTSLGILERILGCESAMTCSIARDERAVLSGTMRQSEFNARSAARGSGVLLGVAVHALLRAGMIATPSAAATAASGVAR